MKLRFECEVQGELRAVFTSFDEDLLRKLTPPLCRLRVEKFEGLSKGDEFIFYMSVLGIESRWEGLFLDSFCSDQECFFTDVGKNIPFPLKAWTHKHVFKNSSSALEPQKVTLIDEVQYFCHFKFFEYLMLPVWYIYFEYRKFMYRKIFNV